MVYRGKIRNGQVAPEDRFPWAEGTEVVVRPLREKSLKNLLGLLDTGGPPPTDAQCERILEEERLRRFAP